MPLITIAKYLIGLGAILLLVGGGLYLAGRLNLPLGHLPGDFVIRRGNFTLAIPLATSILLSILLTLLINLIVRLKK